MNKITEKLLRIISDWKGEFIGAFNIRENGQCVSRQSSKHIQINSKDDGSGLVIHISSKAQNETVYIPACVTHGNVDDLVYNDFYIDDGANVIIVAGCGVETDSEEMARHSGIHRFFVEKNAHVIYKEKHIGIGTGNGIKKINPITDILLSENATLEINTVQIGGIDNTLRKTKAQLKQRAKLIIRESIMTDKTEEATTDFDVSMNGDDSSVNLISRSIARGNSRQQYHSYIKGNCRCMGHSECDAILVDNGIVNASPELFAGNIDAALIHEAAIGKIAGEQIIKLCTLGLTQQQAEEKIIEGFLKG